jgi:predicted nucleic acid-binding protein
MGLILDTSILIAAERRGLDDLEILEQLYALYGETPFGLSVVTIAELMHGAYRAKELARKQKRLIFIDHLCQEIRIYPITIEIARTAGRIEGQQASLGFTLAFEDLAIGVTALQLGYDVATLNDKDFVRIPGLRIVKSE